VGRFSGLDARFLRRLEKPVMTKHASISAKHDAKCPTPSNTETPSPPLHQLFSQRRYSQEWRQSSSPMRRASLSLSPSHTLERHGSGPYPTYYPPRDCNQSQSRLTPPLSHLYIPSSSSFPSATGAQKFDDECGGGFGLPALMSYSSTSTLSDSVVTTPVFATFPLESQDSKTTKKWNRFFSPRTTTFPVVIESSTSTSTDGSEPPTTSLTTRKFEFDQQSAPTPQIHLERARTA